MEMEIFSKPDKTYSCTYCETEFWHLDDGITVYIDLGYGTVLSICATCAKNITE